MRGDRQIYCPHGCGRLATFRFKNGNYCCESNIAKCPSVKAKNSETHKLIGGHPHSEETKVRIQLSNLGQKRTEETKAKLRKPKSIEHRMKLSQARMGVSPWNKGKTDVYSDETIQKIKDARAKQAPTMLGKTHSAETRELIRQARTGKKLSKEHREAIGNAHRGGKRSFETRMKMALAAMGEKSSQWKGGISCEPYCSLWQDKDFKRMIRERDNHSCQNPDCWGEDTRLALHHIDYDKKHCTPDNLITLCSSCNSRANSKREYWKTHYSNIVQQKSI